MNLFGKRALWCVSATLIFTCMSSLNNVSAVEKSSVDINYLKEVNSTRERLNATMDYGEIVTNRNIIIDGQINYLYCEFDNSEVALDNFKQKYSEIVLKILDHFNIGTLDVGNWESFYDYYQKYKSDISEIDEDGNQCLPNSDMYLEIDQFFDIFENKYENNKIINLKNNNSLLESSSTNLDLILSLPNNSPALISYVELSKDSLELFKSQSVMLLSNSNGASYAAANATGYYQYPNYDYLTNDCTNFASQILAASGVSQVVSSSENSGWWHKVSWEWLGSNYVPQHSHSISWIRADTFAKYMGVGYTTTSNYSFSANIRQYDFIAADFSNDGSWNHIGYVTARNSSVGSSGYYDYKVAQHTSNYHAWATSSTNGWDTLGAGGAKCETKFI